MSATPTAPSAGDSTPEASRRGLWLLALGALAGLALAAAGLLAGDDARDGLPADAIAVVNGQGIGRSDYERALAALASDRRDALGEKERRHVLDRLIEEELLLQRGVALGLVRLDRRVRADLVSSLIESIVGDAEAAVPDAEAVAAFYRENLAFFTRRPRLRVERLFVRAEPDRSRESARERALRAAAVLREGATIFDARTRFGDEVVAPVPDALLPLAKLREYLGPALTEAAEALAVGAVSEPLESPSGFHLLRVVERQEAVAPPLVEVESQVRAELRRRRGDEALRAYLDQLRDDAEVVLAPELD